MLLQVTALTLLFVADRLLKNIIWFSLPASKVPAMVHPVLNENFSLSIAVPDVLQWFVVPAIVIVMAFILLKVARSYREHSVNFFWWGLLLCGGMSNLLDRLTLGGVLDYIDLRWFPIFNLSDVYISIAILMLLVPRVSRGNP